MTLSPEQKHRVIEMTAELIVEELKAEMDGSYQSLFCVPLSVAEKMTGLCRRTIQAVLPVVKLTDSKHAVKMSDLRAYIESKTTQPARKR